MWDGKKVKDKSPTATRLHGVKRATLVSVGETHLMIVGSLYHPVYPANEIKMPQELKPNARDESDELDEDFMFNVMESDKSLPTLLVDDGGSRLVPSLKSLCEKVAAECLLEPRNALQLLEIADSLGADDLKNYSEVFFLTICIF